MRHRIDLICDLLFRGLCPRSGNESQTARCHDKREQESQQTLSCPFFCLFHSFSSFEPAFYEKRPKPPPPLSREAESGLIHSKYALISAFLRCFNYSGRKGRSKSILLPSRYTWQFSPFCLMLTPLSYQFLLLSVKFLSLFYKYLDFPLKVWIIGIFL